MRYLALGEVVELHRRLLEATGRAPGIRDFGALESAIARPKATSGGVDVYPALIEKAAALGSSLVQGHAFVDGNKRVARAAMDTFLILNGTEIDAPVDEQERLILDLAAGLIGRSHFVDWLRPRGWPDRAQPSCRLASSARQAARVIAAAERLQLSRGTRHFSAVGSSC